MGAHNALQFCYNNDKIHKHNRHNDLLSQIILSETETSSLVSMKLWSLTHHHMGCPVLHALLVNRNQFFDISIWRQADQTLTKFFCCSNRNQFFSQHKTMSLTHVVTNVTCLLCHLQVIDLLVWKTTKTLQWLLSSLTSHMDSMMERKKKEEKKEETSHPPHVWRHISPTWDNDVLNCF